MSFAENLMALRKQRGWSQEELGNQIGVTRQTVSKWEMGQSTPELEKLVELARLFNMSIDRLVGLEGAEEATEESAARLAERSCAFDLPVKDMGDAELCQVHRGGFSLDAFDLETLEAKAVPGLHVLGEALDMDGACGGFNLHWAFATGMLAGWSLV